jgi:hypothetical protein
MFGCYKKKIEKWGRGVNCEEEMREKKKMRWVRGDVCVWWGKKKRKKKKKKEMGSGKKGRVEKERRKKKLKGKKLNWFYWYVHFIWCKV